mmetsp:Transcript_5681/g.23446  ORF Transcript_5681/g.23446 Transcript_5681/m.23446 type:complete len:332 (-) Transcript_5681:178-1173(-)
MRQAGVRAHPRGTTPPPGTPRRLLLLLLRLLARLDPDRTRIVVVDGRPRAVVRDDRGGALHAPVVRPLLPLVVVVVHASSVRVTRVGRFRSRFRSPRRSARRVPDGTVRVDRRGRRERLDRLPAPAGVHQTDRHGAVEVSVQSPAEGVAHRAEPTPHCGRPAAVGQRRVRPRCDGLLRVERVWGTHRPDRVLVRLRRDVRRDVVHGSLVRLHLERRESHERVVTRVRDVRVRVEGARHRELHVALARAQPNLPERDVAAHDRREPGGGDDELEAGGRRHGGKPRGPRAGGVGDGGGHRARGSAEVPVGALASVRSTRRSPRRLPRGLRRLG